MADAAEPILLEITYEGDHCIPCVYMVKVVEAVAPEYGDALDWRKVVLTRREGALRFDALSKRLGRLAPVPAIFINGDLAFDATPGEDQLRRVLDRYIDDDQSRAVDRKDDDG